jgi:hypothetical protein
VACRVKANGSFSRRCFNAGEHSGFRRIVAFAIIALPGAPLAAAAPTSNTSPQCTGVLAGFTIVNGVCVPTPLGVWYEATGYTSLPGEVKVRWPGDFGRPHQGCESGRAKTNIARCNGDRPSLSSGGAFPYSLEAARQKNPACRGVIVACLCVEELFLLLSGTTRYPTRSTDYIRVRAY